MSPLLLLAAQFAPDSFLEWVRALPTGWRILTILGLAVVAHLLVRLLQALGDRILAATEPPRGGAPPGTGPAPGSATGPGGRRTLLRPRSPKVRTVTGLVVSALTFTVYFLALGFLLGEFTPLTLGQYLASATVIGLAVGFGTQGLVQDIVTGLTLIFSDTLDVGDLVEISGQTGRVERVGLRFTLLTTFTGRTVYVPNRNIATIGRYRAGYARAFVDVQLSEGIDEGEAIHALRAISVAFRNQHAAVLVGEPRIHPVQRAGEDGWRFLRVRFRLWPGQQALVEGPFRQRTIARMRELDPAFQDWMVTVTYRIAAPPGERPSTAQGT